MLTLVILLSLNLVACWSPPAVPDTSAEPVGGGELIGEVSEPVAGECDGGGSGQLYYPDADGDGHGGVAEPVTACEVPMGYASSSDDCDDGDPSVHPGAEEVCDGIDNDCEGDIDVGAVEAPTWYADADGDGFGRADTHLQACAPSFDYVADNSDCNDYHPGIYPGADEYCDGLDNDCDGVFDEDAVDPHHWYQDADGDYFGDATDVVYSCSDAWPPGRTINATDCDDLDQDVHPGAVEHCDGVDENCDGVVDDDLGDGTIWFLDLDGDGFGHGDAWPCAPDWPIESADNDDDCDDLDAQVHPDQIDDCDGIDSDCDGIVDQEPAMWFLDLDGDGFGDVDAYGFECWPPGPTEATGTDCDDAVAAVNVVATETCDGIDQDCDGNIDDDPIDGIYHFPDLDGDGFGVWSGSARKCSPSGVFVAAGGDCDDADPSVNPGAAEVCDDLEDHNCDGDTAAGCGAPEICDNEIDDDLDGLIDCADRNCFGPGCPEDCANGFDDDGDWDVDCWDADCAGQCPQTCGWGPDSDLDGLIGWDDPDCGSPIRTWLCEDTNYDGISDGPDTDCGPHYPREYRCDDGVDNDGDGLIDCEDAECADGYPCVELCDNHRDDDLDGLVDCGDDDCFGPACVGAPRATVLAVGSMRTRRGGRSFGSIHGRHGAEFAEVEATDAVGSVQVLDGYGQIVEQCVWTVEGLRARQWGNGRAYNSWYWSKAVGGIASSVQRTGFDVGAGCSRIDSDFLPNVAPAVDGAHIPLLTRRVNRKHGPVYDRGSSWMAPIPEDVWYQGMSPTLTGWSAHDPPWCYSHQSEMFQEFGTILPGEPYYAAPPG